ncbi:uncharacterized protein V1518DRAFT_411317 [Limtongia smithiae]|uniref:uncharacterized protein n=1 Tax=Limtongia smithiae TaxID=1125753 RepID=UPI0034CEB0F3
MAKKTAGRSNKRAARRELPDAPVPARAIHAAALDPTPRNAATFTTTSFSTKKSVLHVASKRHKSKISKAEIRQDMLVAKIEASKQRNKMVLATRNIVANSTSASTTPDSAVVVTDSIDVTTSSAVNAALLLSKSSSTKKLRGRELLRLAGKIKVGAAGMDVDVSDDEDDIMPATKTGSFTALANDDDDDSSDSDLESHSAFRSNAVPLSATTLRAVQALPSRHAPIQEIDVPL